MDIIIEYGGTREATREALGRWLDRSPWAERLLELIFAWSLAKSYAEGYAIGLEHTKGYAIGLEQGRARGIAKTLAWVERRDAALEKGEPFDEPPPWALG